jgi:hypothetical protein
MVASEEQKEGTASNGQVLFDTVSVFLNYLTNFLN